jgi:manganese-dependent inorganic pyrophosphatase
MPGATIYVLGHKNPDSDSICSAVGYAALLHLQGQPEAVAARQGVLRRETTFILERFGILPPVLVTDVRPRVADVMTTPAVCAHQDQPLYEVGLLLQEKKVRAIPVLDDDRLVVGVVGVEDFAQFLITGLNLEELNHVQLDLESVVRALDGQVLVAAPGRTLRDRVMVGAMDIDSMIKRIEPDILLVMGDRSDAQRAAIEFGVGALVITGDKPVAPEILALARTHNVGVITVPHHTFTTVRLIQMSTPVRHIMRTAVPTCGPTDLVEDVREILRSGPYRSLVVVDDDRRILGMISRTNLLRNVRRRVVLVDHNERSQSVAGIEEAEIIGVIDHHRVADFQTAAPPFMRLEPVGSTSTIVAKLFEENEIPIPPAIAGVLLSGILADTLLFRGPTTTDQDRQIATRLAARAGVDMHELGTGILVLASDVSDRSAQQLLTTDFKDFSIDGAHFGIGVIETTNAADVLARRSEILAEMAHLRERGYTSLLFAVIDILRDTTTLLIEGHADAVAEVLGAPLDATGAALQLPGILSRKKQLVPQLGAIARRIARPVLR